MPRCLALLAPLAGLALLVACPATAPGGVVLNFATNNNFGVNNADLDAKVTLAAAGGVLTIGIENTSPAAALANLYFNAASAGTFTYQGTSSDQVGFPDKKTPTLLGGGHNAAGFGDFDYVLDFGNGANDRLLAGKSATFTFAYTGTIADADLLVKADGNDARGDHPAAMHFYLPGTTGFASGDPGVTTVVTVTSAPEPSTLAGGAMAVLAGLAYAWRRRRARASA